MAYSGTGTVINLYPLSHFTFGTKDALKERDSSVEARMERHKARFEEQGMRRVVEGVALVHEHGHPHVLLLTVMGGRAFRLPGGRLRPGEEEVAGMRRKLQRKVGNDKVAAGATWEVDSEPLGRLWRPGWDCNVYPYVPAHSNRPKECRTLFLCPINERTNFAIPRGLDLKAVSLYELHGNEARYGPVLASLPTLLSRYTFNCL